MKFYKLETQDTLQLWEGLPDEPLYEGHEIKPDPKAVEISEKEYESIQESLTPDEVLKAFEDKDESNNGKALGKK